MRERKDPLLEKLPKYDTFVNSLYSKANANQATWAIPALAVNGFLLLLNKWNAKWTISKNKASANTVDRTATTTARKNLTRYLRPFIQIYIMRNDALTDADRIKCGLQPYKKRRTKIGKPQTLPSMKYFAKGSHVIEAFYRQASKQKGVTGRGKPLHVAFCKIAYYVGDNAPSDPEDFPKVIMSGSKPIRIAFKAADARKKVTFAACWVSTSNLDGDWTRMQTMYIP